MASDDDRPPAIGTDPPPRGGSRPIAWTSDRERQTSSRLRSALIAAAFQYVATGLGVLRGVGTHQAPGWIPSVLGWLPSLTNLGLRLPASLPGRDDPIHGLVTLATGSPQYWLAL